MVVALVALFVALGGSAFAVSQVGTKQLKNAAVTTAKIRNGAVTNAKLGNGSVTGAKVRANSIDGSRLMNGSVGVSKIGADAIGEAQLIDGSVTGSKVGPNAVGETQLIDGSVTEAKIAPSARPALRGALAYGLVSASSPSLVTTSTSGFSNVNRPSPGIYCLTPTAEVAALAIGQDGNPVRPMLTSVDWGRTPSSAEYPFVLPNASSKGGCAAGQYEVHTSNPAGTPSNQISFIVAIP